MSITAYRRPTVRPGVDLHLDANEGPRAADRMCSILRALDPELLRRYPDAAGLEGELARELGVEPRNVLVTAGADDGIDRCCRLALGRGGNLIMPRPGFEMFRRYAELSGGRVVGVDWSGGPFPVDRFLSATDPQTRAIAVISPNNPTGAVATSDDVRRLAGGVPDALIIVDAAYAEFADEDLTGLARELPNVVALRSFSKAWGLAGLRVGFVTGAQATVERLRAGGPPYAVSGPSLAIAAAVRGAGRAQMREHVDRVRQERARLTEVLRRDGAEVVDSQANFVLVRRPDAVRVHEDLQALGIAVRCWPADPALSDAIRIGCPGDDQDFARLTRALRTVLAPEAILFDMDGVLADEGDSYREAIVCTARSYGVETSHGAIAARKAAGNANNDWDLTFELLRSAGVEVSRDEVVRRFESYYQGTGNTPGFWTRERPLVDPDWLERLARRFRLGVVTGRPSRDAHRFLERNGIADCFSAVVTLDDAPPKPDPAPVRLALSHLGCEAAWMIGDTPDDARAARAAGVLPLGVLPPVATDAVAASALIDAGCARVLDRPEDLEEWLP